MNPLAWPLKRVAKVKKCRYRVWLLTVPLQPLPNGGAVELRLHLKQWDKDAAEPYSWCLQWTKYATKVSRKTGRLSMDPYKPFQLLQISERDWPTFFATMAPDFRQVLDEHLPRFMAAAPPVQTAVELPKEASVA